MGQKVNPNGFRYGITKDHNAIWYADKDNFAKYLHEDIKIRKYFNKFIREYKIGNIEISRNQKEEVVVFIHSASPGVILGQGSENLKKILNNIKKFIRNKNINLKLEVISIDEPDLNATLVAEQIAIGLENRGSFRVLQKVAMRNAFKAGAIGVKTQVSGRLNGVDMARTEGYQQGIMALHTLRQNVDFANASAHTTYGVIGVKIWISKRENINNKNIVKDDN